jgi:hypothetical protein
MSLQFPYSVFKRKVDIWKTNVDDHINVVRNSRTQSRGPVLYYVHNLTIAI